MLTTGTLKRLMKREAGGIGNMIIKKVTYVATFSVAYCEMRDDVVDNSIEIVVVGLG